MISVKSIFFVIGRVMATLAFLASMMVVPAFANGLDPVQASNTNKTAEIDSVQSADEARPSEGTLAIQLHYLDFTPENKITHKQEKDDEWVYSNNNSDDKYKSDDRIDSSTSATPKTGDSSIIAHITALASLVVFIIFCAKRRLKQK